MSQRHAIPLTIFLGMFLGVTACGKSSTQESTEPRIDGCPRSAQEIGRLDWGLSEANEGAVIAGVLAATELDLMLDSLEVELTEACGALAKQVFAREKDLTPEQYDRGTLAEKACSVARDNVAQLMERAGGTTTVSVGPITCSVPQVAARDCVATCGESRKAECMGQLRGDCPGTCNGMCVDTDGGSCSGSCSGSCDGSCDSSFKGTCDGKCEGTCDGKPSKDSCQGTCEGRCLEGASGTCGGTCTGQCRGSCSMMAAGECTDICEGECDQPLTGALCVGQLTLSGEGTPCSQSCDAELMGARQCDKPVVTVKVEGAKDEEAADILKRTLPAYLPAILGAAALNVDAAQLYSFAEKSQAAIEAMQAAAQAPAEKGSESKLTEEAQSCMQEKVKTHAASVAGLPTLVSAADTAREIAPLTSGSD